MITVRGYSVFAGEDGNIVITQPIEGADNSVIAISPDQLDSFIRALQQANRELAEEPCEW